MKLSVIIPSYKDKYLCETISSILGNAGIEDIEVIAVLDGYWPKFNLIEHPKVRYVHLGGNRGMRGAINAGVAVASGEYIMRSDEHCDYGKDFAKIMLESIQPNWIMTARRYYLNPNSWTIMDELGCVDFEKLVIQGASGVKKFTGFPCKRDGREQIVVDETMAMQGSFWIMSRKWWDTVIGELQTEGYGPLLQDSHEMVFKTWKAGGKLMVNKNTWFAHKHVSFPRTHQYGGGQAKDCLKYSFDTWIEYYRKEIKPRWREDKPVGVSVIIPARKERFLDDTIREIQEKFVGTYEIIVTLDGYDTDRIDGVRYIHNKEARGMRTAINQAVAEARGTYIMKLDAHCMLDEGIDIKLRTDHKDNWVQIPRRKRLDAKRWELINDDRPDIDYMYLSDFMGIVCRGKNKDMGLKTKLIDDIETFQGSCYFIKRDYFNKLGLLDDKNFGGNGHEAQEITLKCLHDGGRVVRNKKTWYGHARLGRFYSKEESNIDRSRAYISTCEEIYGNKSA